MHMQLVGKDGTKRPCYKMQGGEKHSEVMVPFNARERKNARPGQTAHFLSVSNSRLEKAD